MRLGFAGTPQFAVPALDALIASRHRVVAVFTQPDRPAGRGRELKAGAVKARALHWQLPIHQPRSLKTPEAEALLHSLELDALVVVAYGLILPPALLAAPRLGCFNIHASLLPRWRGAAPIQRAVLAGDAVTGITIMRMEAGLDTGPMLAVREWPIAAADTAGTVHDALARVGGELIVHTLDALAEGEVQERPQPLTGITYADKISKAEASIDWREDGANILRRVRAFNPWPVAETGLDGQQLRVWEAVLAPDAVLTATVGEAGTVADAANVGEAAPGTVLAASSDGIDVACGRGALRLLRLQLAGRKPLAAREFVHSRHLVGARFVSP